MKTINDVVKYMDKINPHDIEYEYNKLYFYENDEWYEHILAFVKKITAMSKELSMSVVIITSMVIGLKMKVLNTLELKNI